MPPGDFSIIRDSKKTSQEKGYRKVLLQQGRVLTDSDWNEQVDIQVRHDRFNLRDIIGDGVPVDQKDSSFRIIPIGGNKYTIGVGRIYVDGIMVENFSVIEGALQPYLPSVENKTSEAIPKIPGLYLVYLDVWDREITYIEDPEIQESALGGPDTSIRTKQIWQVKWHLLKDGEPTGEIPVEDNWISMKELQISVNSAGTIRAGKNKDGNLELCVTGSDGKLYTKRQISAVEDKWEDIWSSDQEQKIINGFEVASDSNDRLNLFAFDTGRFQLLQKIKEDVGWSSWMRIASDVNAGPGMLGIGYNNNRMLGVFYLGPNLQNQVVYLQQKAGGWETPKPTGRPNMRKFCVITNPNTRRIELFGISNTDDKIYFSTQSRTNSTDWEPFRELSPGSRYKFDNIIAGTNKIDEIVIFASEKNERFILSTIRDEQGSPEGNGWEKVGSTTPGKLITGPDGHPINRETPMSVQKHQRADNRLKLFAIFSETGSDRGNIFTIIEDDNGLWKSDWTLIEFESPLAENEIRSLTTATDSLSRISIFVPMSIAGLEKILHTNLASSPARGICKLDVPSWESKTKPSTGKLRARARPEVLPTDSCMLPESAGYKRLENQLYRIEIHEPKSPGKNATFKYSTDNGSLSSKILNISGETITVESLGRDKSSGFKSYQYVEVTDDLHELWNIPGVLVKIKEIDLDGNNLTFESSAGGPPVDNENFPQKYNPKIRRWDSPGTLEVTMPSNPNEFIKIGDDGIEVQFSTNENECRTGDYWTIPGRTLKSDIIWPKLDGNPEFVDTEGIEHHYAKLAFFELTQANELKEISDCRKSFIPLNVALEKSAEQPNGKSNNIVCWTHGTLSLPEYPWRLENKPITPEDIGLGKIYIQKADTSSNWFHFPVTSNYPLSDNRKTVIKEIYLLFKTDTAKISKIRVCDGAQKIFEKELSLSGAHSKKPDEFNTFKLDPEGMQVYQGVTISVEVQFDPPQGSVSFACAGVQIETI